MTKAVFPRLGRTAIAASIKLQPIHLAWGLGDGVWTTPPDPSVDQPALQNEIGRRTAIEVSYVEPDESGEIVIEGEGRFSRTTDPTNRLYAQFKFDFADASSAVIREIGVFAGTVADPALPPGQMYFTPAQIVEQGFPLLLENKAPIYRSTSTRETFEIVIPF